MLSLLEITTAPTSSPAPISCESVVNMVTMLHYTMAPAFAILIILQAYDYYLTRKFHLITPFMFLLDNDRKRIMTVLGFGAVVGQLLQILMGQDIPTFFSGIFGHTTSATIYVLEIAISNYPIFACIDSVYVMIASILGALYALFKLSVLFVRTCYVKCSDENPTEHILIDVVTNLPNILCYLILLYIFFKNIFKSLKTKVYIKSDIGDVVVRKYQTAYVKRTLNVNRTDCTRANFFKRLQGKFSKPWFKYSTEFLSCIVIITIMYYSFFILGIYNYVKVNEQMISLLVYLKTSNKYTLIKKLTDGLLISYGVSMSVTTLTYIGLVIHFCYTHRNNVLSVYAGRKIEFMEHIKYRSMIRYNLLFPGYMVAYMTWGMLVFFFVFLILFYAIYAFVVVSLEMHVVGAVAVSALKYIASTLLIPLLIYILQIIKVYFVFIDKQSLNMTAVRNIKLYHISIYFFFFFNILIGLVSCLSRSLSAFAVSLLFLGRIDQTAMVSNLFKTFDSGYVSYISFLFIQTRHRNPNMRFFCQILLDSIPKDLPSQVHDSSYKRFANLEEEYTERVHRIKNYKAFNRWFLALTLHRNPGLIPYRHKLPQPHEDNNELINDNNELMAMV